MLIIAHRGFSSRHPEQTVAAYAAAIAWCAETGVELTLECDVQFSADDELICLHDLDLDRTSNGVGPAFAHTVTELRRLDFGGWKLPAPSSDQRALITLDELMIMVAEARDTGVPVGLAIETKHPNPRDLDIEDRVAQMLGSRGWDRPGSPVRVMSFSPRAVSRLGELLPHLERTLLIEQQLGPWASGDLPPGVHLAGPDLSLVKRDPGFVARARALGNAVHVWTVNEYADVRFCLDLGVAAIITDHPDRVARLLVGRS